MTFDEIIGVTDGHMVSRAHKKTWHKPSTGGSVVHTSRWGDRAAEGDDWHQLLMEIAVKAVVSQSSPTISHSAELVLRISICREYI